MTFYEWLVSEPRTDIGMQAVWNAALDQAAKVCQEHGDHVHANTLTQDGSFFDEAAEKIRALQSH